MELTNGEAARERREQLGMTQEQLADRLGVDQGTVAHWELGTRRPRLAHLHAWADALDWPVYKLLPKKENGPKAALS